MAITILRSGVLDTIQDNGRCGFSHLGINISGSMDRYAMKAANILAANEMDAPVLEMHFPAPQILFEHNALIALSGGNFSPSINGEPVAMWKPLLVKKKSVLQFTKKIFGARCYLAIHGGFGLHKWLNSYSTNLKAKAGGYKGRKLEKGDELPFNKADLYFGSLIQGNTTYQFPWSANCQNVYRHPHEIGIIPGKEWELLPAAAKQKLTEHNFLIHPSSDRMGYNLRGPELAHGSAFQLVSSAVTFGTIQLLPDNQLIILMADHQTAGGFPRIAHVVAAHLPKLAQLGASDALQFKLMDREQAEEMYLDQQKELLKMRFGCEENMNQLLCMR